MVLLNRCIEELNWVYSWCERKTELVMNEVGDIAFVLSTDFLTLYYRVL